VSAEPVAEQDHAGDQPGDLGVKESTDDDFTSIAANGFAVELEPRRRVKAEAEFVTVVAVHGDSMNRTPTGRHGLLNPLGFCQGKGSTAAVYWPSE
jgi:hypothetical protein